MKTNLTSSDFYYDDYRLYSWTMTHTQTGITLSVMVIALPEAMRDFKDIKKSK